MKFCPVVPEICRGQVHGARKERRITRTRRIIIIIIIIRNGAKTISLQTLFGRLNKKRSKNNKSPKLCLGDLITILCRTYFCCQGNCKYFVLLLIVHFKKKITASLEINICQYHQVKLID